jgi:hypothetical protein
VRMVCNRGEAPRLEGRVSERPDQRERAFYT